MTLRKPDTHDFLTDTYRYQHAVILTSKRRAADGSHNVECSIAHYYEPALECKPNAVMDGRVWVVGDEPTRRPVPQSVIVGLYDALGLFPREPEDEYPDRCGGVLMTL